MKKLIPLDFHFVGNFILFNKIKDFRQGTHTQIPDR